MSTSDPRPDSRDARVHVGGDASINKLLYVEHLYGNVFLQLQPATEPLKLRSPRVELPPVLRSPALLLRASFEVVPFRGRRDELGIADEWLRSTDPLAVMVVHGPGGRGKTRFAGEMCHRSLAKDWLAGFVPHRHASDERLAALAELDRPLLLVVDYAETRGDLIVRLLEQMASRPAPKPPCRLVLLARRLGGWRETLVQRTHDLLVEAALRDGLYLDLPPVEGTAEGRAQAFLAAAERFTQVLRLPAKAPVVPELSDPVFDNLLFIHIAALAALDPAGAAILTKKRSLKIREDLLADLLNREGRYWAETAAGAGLDTRRFDDALRRRSVAVATLTGAESEPELVAVLGAIPELTDDKDRHPAARWLADLYPGHDYFNPLEPDLIGEALIAEVIQAVPGLCSVALTLATPIQHHRALTVLNRGSPNHLHLRAALSDCLAAHFTPLIEPAIQVAQETGDPIGQLLAQAIEQRSADPDLMQQVFELMPVHTTALRELAATVTRHALVGLDQPSDADSAGQKAILLNILSERQAQLGRREECLEAAKEATTIWRQLASEEPDNFLSGLAASLNNLSRSLTGLGRREESLEAAKEATTIWRQLAGDLSDNFLPELTLSLNNLSDSLAQLGRPEEALDAAEEATTIWLKLTAEDTNTFPPELAAESLSGLSFRLRDLGRHTEALEAIEEGVRRFRELAADQPDAFLPSLAWGLNGLSVCLYDMRRRTEALGPAEEAVRHYRGLAAARPDAFLPHLATCLSNLSLRLGSLGRHTEALGPAEEVSAIYRKLAAAHPGAFLPELALALVHFSTSLHDLGRSENAVEAVKESAAIYRKLAAAHPGAFLPELARSLIRLSDYLGCLGRHNEALAAAKESAAIYRKLAAAHPGAFLPELARSLFHLSDRLWRLRRRKDALGILKEAVAIQRKLAAHEPDAFLLDLTRSLHNLSVCLRSLGHYRKALTAIEESLSIQRDLAAHEPDALLPGLANSWYELSLQLKNLGRREEALSAVEEAVRRYRGLAAGEPDAFLPRLAKSLNNLSLQLKEAERYREAADVMEEAMAVRHQLASPPSGLVDLTRSTNALPAEPKASERLTRLWSRLPHGRA